MAKGILAVFSCSVIVLNFTFYQQSAENLQVIAEASQLFSQICVGNVSSGVGTTPQETTSLPHDLCFAQDLFWS